MFHYSPTSARCLPNNKPAELTGLLEVSLTPFLTVSDDLKMNLEPFCPSIRRVKDPPYGIRTLSALPNQPLS